MKNLTGYKAKDNKHKAHESVLTAESNYFRYYLFANVQNRHSISAH